MLNKILNDLQQTTQEINNNLPLLQSRSNYDNKYPAFNIKVYDYLSESDVETIIDKSTLSELAKERILEEFDSDRLNSIFNHTCDQEIEYLLDAIGYEDEYNELEKDCFEVQGKGGGWLVYANHRHNPFDLDANLKFPYEVLENLGTETNLALWRKLLPEIWHSAPYYDCKATIEWLESDLEQLQTINTQLKQLIALGKIIKLIKGDFKSYLVDNLEYEIKNFIENELEELVVVKNTIAKIENDIVTTNEWAKCTISEARDALKKLKEGNLAKGDKIGNYTFRNTFEHEGKLYAKVGCHKFLISELEAQLTC